jgi:hypothetical protein
MKYLLWDEGRGNMLAYRAFATRFLQPCPTCSERGEHRKQGGEQDDVNKTTMNKAINETAENA